MDEPVGASLDDSTVQVEYFFKMIEIQFWEKYNETIYIAWKEEV